ncbi:hypothetical protein [Photobacterium damselae]|uniref:hypothetical protein n=1 Tax=Photobacterium damselae TaxID=38293 RepID=UPI001F3F9A9D|nr:hypothetical protein [Photobacterium damselae]UKA28452.1 hypothetical protein IPQ37_10285 [Photobacterium damselae subsp. damselae]
MTQKNKLISELNKYLGNSKIAKLLNNSNSDLYEAYIFSIVLQAAKLQGAKVYFENINGNVTNSLLFRTSPGNIYSKAKDYTHAVIEFPDFKIVEVHIGIKVTGMSGVTHEADVAIIERSEGETCRLQNVHPRHTKLIFAVECKYYFTNLGINLARSFLGLDKEFNSKKVFFVSNTTSRSVEKILSKHSRNWDRNIIPRFNNDTNRLTSQFQVVFRDFIASRV